MGTKKRQQVLHAKRRAAQRYDLNLNEQEYTELCKQIQSGEAIFVEKQSNRVSVFIVVHLGKELKVVYDKNRHQIVTFLPETQNGLLVSVL